jgi:uncharacterized protein DUF4339
MRENWHYSVSGQQIGPVTLQQLQDVLATLPPDDVLVWHESFPERWPAGEAATLIADQRFLDTMAASTTARYVHKTGIESNAYCSVTGLLLGGFIIVLGCVVLFAGLAGDEQWSAAMRGFSNTLVDALPGALLFQIGIFVIWITRQRAHE